MGLRDSAPKTTASEKAGFVFSPAWTRSLSKLSGTAYTLANLTVASVVLVVALEWVVRGSLQDVGTFITSSARPGMTTIAAVLALLVALDAILGRRYLSLIAVAPLCALVGLISAQKQTYLSDPLYPSDLLFGRQILELLPTMLKAQPFTAMLVGVGLSAAIASLAALWLLAHRHSPVLRWRERAAGLALALPLLASLASLMDYSHYSWVRDRLNIIPMMWISRKTTATTAS